MTYSLASIGINFSTKFDTKIVYIFNKAMPKNPASQPYPKYTHDLTHNFQAQHDAIPQFNTIAL
jgi:hypothetical protein